MNAEQLLNYLNDETRLYNLNYQEMKSLVVQYPYCQSLRMLLWQKSFLEHQHPDQERNLQMAATYSIDKRFLYRKMQHLTTIKPNLQETVIMGEDYLELPALSDVERILQEKQPTPAPAFITPEPIATAVATSAMLENFVVPKETKETKETKKEKEEEEITVPIITIEKPTTEKKTIYDDVEDDDELSLIFAHINPSIEQEKVEKVEKIVDADREAQPIKEDFTVSFAELFEENEEIEADNEDEEEDILASIIAIKEIEQPKEVKTTVTATLPQISEQAEEDILDSLFSEFEHLDSFEKTWQTPKIPQIDLEIVNEEKIQIIENHNPEMVVPALQTVSFTAWLQQFRMSKDTIKQPQPPQEEVNRRISDQQINAIFENEEEIAVSEFIVPFPQQIKRKKDKKDKKKKNRPELHPLAEQSITENEDVASETLADLLVWQGKSDKAIEMYERLMQKMPEKSDFFRQKIEKLKK